jgi:hypothetical protein
MIILYSWLLFYYYFFITINNIAILLSNMNTTTENEKNTKPLIGFEPRAYALPWDYSTTELKEKGLVHGIPERVTLLCR